MRVRAWILSCLLASSALAADPVKPKLVPRPAAQTAVPLPSTPEKEPLTEKWWVWTALGVVATGAFAAAAIAVSKPQPRATTLPDGDFR